MATSVAPVPAAPAPAVPLPPGAPAQTAVERATADALSRVAQTGTALPARVPGNNPDGGQFTDQPRKEVGANAQPAPGAAPAAGQPAPVADPAAPAPGTQPAAAAAPAATEEPAPAEPTGPDPLAVELPIAVADGELPFVLKADDEATATALREFVEEATIGRQSTTMLADAERQLDQLDEIRTFADAAPAGFTIDLLKDDRAAAVRLAKFLVTQPSVWTEVAPFVEQLKGGPTTDQFRLANLEASRAVDLERAEAQNVMATDKAVRANLREVQTAAAALIPADFPAERFHGAYELILSTLESIANANNLVILPPEKVPVAAARALAALGINADDAAARVTAALARSKTGKGATAPTGRFRVQPAAAPAAPKLPAAPATPAKPVAAPRTGAAFVASAGRKAAVAAVPGAGAGSPGVTSGLQPPKNADGSAMSIEQTIAWHRAQNASGKKLI